VSNGILLLVLLAALIHAGWNGLIKSAKIDPMTSMAMMCLAGALVSLPFFVFTGLPPNSAYPYLLVSGFVHIPYYLLVGYCYRHGHFSAIYPIFRGGAPLLTVLAGSVFLGEWLALPVYFGVITLVVGLLILSLNALKKGGITKNSLMMAITLACVVALYTVIDGMGVRASKSPFSYVLATHIANSIFMLPVILFYIKPDVRAIKPLVWGKIMAAGALSIIAYAIVLYAMMSVPVGIVSALRETSVLFAAFIGWLFLGEKLGRMHFYAAILIVIALMLIKGLV
jgi:drug/metabolite transporter (DMT)-like permease